MVLGITEFKRLPRFEKAYGRLGEQVKKQVDEAIVELRACAELPSGRNLKKVKSRKNTWAVRVSRGIRLSFEVEGGTCTLRNVGNHDKTLEDP